MAKNSTTEQLRKENAEETKTEMHTTKQMKMAEKRKQKQQVTMYQISEKILPYHAYRQVDSRTITLEARLGESIESDKKPHQIGAKTNDSEKQTDLLIQDDSEYADDARLFIANGNLEQMCERMGNYDISAQTRDLEIQWAKVPLLVHAGRGPKEELPLPLDQIRFSQGGTILGKEIYMTGNLNKAVEARIRNANNTWGQASRKIFRNKAFSRKIKTLLWNSLI